MIGKIHMRDQVNNRVEVLMGAKRNHQWHDRLFKLCCVALILIFIGFTETL